MIDDLRAALDATTTLCRKGPIVRDRVWPSGIQVTTIDAMPPVPDPAPGIELVDVHFATVAVNRDEAMKRQQAIIASLNAWPRDIPLERGLSFIHLGGVLGDQGYGLRLLGLGKALGLWSVITPATIGFEGEDAEYMAGAGFVMARGFKPEAIVL